MAAGESRDGIEINGVAHVILYDRQRLVRPGVPPMQRS
jgi:hypothetical protein